jgi:hypothetical protein
VLDSGPGLRREGSCAGERVRLSDIRGLTVTERPCPSAEPLSDQHLFLTIPEQRTATMSGAGCRLNMPYMPGPVAGKPERK